jgi:hypothetical protein
MNEPLHQATSESTHSAASNQAEFRKAYKAGIASWYNGWGHMLSIFVPGVSVIWFCLARIEAPTVWELAMLVPVFVAYNFSEWWLHKNALHGQIRGLGGVLLPVHHRHTHQHHRYFTARQMTYDSNREWRIVLFPPYALMIFLLVTVPPALALGYLWSPNAGYLLLMLTPVYYLNYEIFHLCCHVHDNAFVRHCPLINTIRRHHAAHHSQPIMMERNMNLTYPIADWFFGTSDLDRGLLGHLFNGYSERHVRPEFASDQGGELDARKVLA